MGWKISEMDHKDFNWDSRKGAWTFHTKGVFEDCNLAKAATPEARRWCKAYGLKDNSSWSFKAYGEENCVFFAMAWCWRHQQLFDWYTESPFTNFAYDSKMLDNLSEPPEFEAMAAAALPGSQLYKRVEQLRSVRPRGKVSHPEALADTLKGKASSSGKWD